MNLKLLAAATCLAGTAALLPGTAEAVPDPYIGQVIAVGEDYCPDQYLPAHGQTLAITSYPALYAVVGCAYGGNCTSTFALPDLRARSMTHVGDPGGLLPVSRGVYFGQPDQSLASSEMPAHTHRILGARDGGGITPSPANAALPTYSDPNVDVYANGAASGTVPLNPATIADTGNGTAFDMYQPVTAINYCVAVDGYFPPHP